MTRSGTRPAVRLDAASPATAVTEAAAEQEEQDEHDEENGEHGRQPAFQLVFWGIPVVGAR
jgi:hypothetical protein